MDVFSSGSVRARFGIHCLDVACSQDPFLELQFLDFSPCSNQCTASSTFNEKGDLSPGSAQARFGVPFLKVPCLLCFFQELKFLDFSSCSKRCTFDI